MSSPTVPNDIGVELWALVYHLFSVYARLHRPAHDAFRELCLRTRCSIHTSDFTIVHKPECVVNTKWYKEMCTRYKHMYTRVYDAHSSKINEADELISDMYPNGCSVSSFTDTVQTCLAMLSFSVAPVYVERYLQVQTDKIASRHIHQFDKTELQSSITHELIIPSFVPMRWWTHDELITTNNNSLQVSNGGNSSISTCVVRRVGLKVKPPTIVIEYVQSSVEENTTADIQELKQLNKEHFRHRRIVLCSNNAEIDKQTTAVEKAPPKETNIATQELSRNHEHNSVYATLPFEFTNTTPTTVLARRLAASHDALLSETQFQKLLVKLQQLMRHDTIAGTSNNNDSVINNNLNDYNKMNGNSSASLMTAAEEVLNTKINEPLVEKDVIADKTEMSTSLSTNNNNNNNNNSNNTNLEVQKADLGLLYRDPERALHNVDLNSADDITLREFKEAMDEKFKRNVLKPGDVGYVYDKRVSVAAPTEKSEWDDDDDDDDDNDDAF